MFIEVEEEQGTEYKEPHTLTLRHRQRHISSVNLDHHCHDIILFCTLQTVLYSHSPVSINTFSTISVAVRATDPRARFPRSSSSTSIPSPSSVPLRFFASQCKYSRLYRGAGFRAVFRGGAANHRTSFVSGSRSKCLAEGFQR